MNENILIVDNNAATRNSTKAVLEESEYHTFISSSAKEAIKLLKTTTVDIVITDVVLPDQDGLEFTDLIKQNHDVDVIVMTDYSGNYSYEDVIYRGASDLVFKPVRPEELLLRLKRVIKERHSCFPLHLDLQSLSGACWDGFSCLLFLMNQSLVCCSEE